MNDDLIKFIIEVTDSNMGEVVGKLNTIGAWIDNLEYEEEVASIEARIPYIEIKYFKEWLNKFTNGTGLMKENA